MSKATKTLQKLAQNNANNFKLPPLPDFPKMDMDTFKNIDFQDMADMVQTAQKGFNMIQDNLDHPMVKEGLNKLNDIDVIKKLKDIDTGEAMNKFKDLTNNLEDAKKHASNVFKLF